MTTKASTKYRVSKKVVKRYLADHDLTQKQLAQMAGITHLAVPQVAMINDMLEVVQNG
jgi:hypothetical protein